jgi:ribonuclease P protein component
MKTSSIPTDKKAIGGFCLMNEAKSLLFKDFNMLPNLTPLVFSQEQKIENFSRVFEKGHRFKFPAFQAVCRITSNTSKNTSTYSWAVVASKKAVDKRATRRNFCKRRLRALLTAADLQGSLEPGEHLELVVLGGKQVVSQNFSLLQQQVSLLAEKIEQALKLHRGNKP